MKKLLLYLILLLSTIAVRAQLVVGPDGRGHSASSNNAFANANELNAGYHTKATLAGRDSLSNAVDAQGKRVYVIDGTLCYVTQTDTTYMWKALLAQWRPEKKGDVTKAYVDSVAASKNLQAVTNAGFTTTNPLYSTNKVYAGDSTNYRQVVYFGTSYTAGGGSDSKRDTNTYVYVSSKRIGAVAVNLGYSGRFTQSNGGSNSIYSQRFNIPKPVTPNSILVIEPLPNDLRSDTLVYRPEVFNTQIGEILDAVISNGWTPSNIVLFNPFYFSLTATTRGGNIKYRHGLYYAAMQAQAQSHGTKAMSLFDNFKLRIDSGQVLLMPDSLHGTAEAQILAGKILADSLKVWYGQKDYDTNRDRSFGSLQVAGTANLNIINSAGPAFLKNAYVNGYLHVYNSGNITTGIMLGSQAGTSTIINGSNKAGLISVYPYSSVSNPISVFYYQTAGEASQNLSIGGLAAQPAVTGMDFTTRPTDVGGLGALRMRITAAGNVLIGTASEAAGTRLRILGGRLERTGSYSMGKGTQYLASSLNLATSTVTDTVSTDGTVKAWEVNASMSPHTFASTAPNVTITNAASFYFEGAPIAGANTTITNPYVLYINGGRSYLGAGIGVGTVPIAGARVMLGAGSTAIAPIRLTSGTLNSTAVAGSLEYLTNTLYFTPSTAIRYQLPLSTAAPTANQIMVGTAAGVYTPFTMSGDGTLSSGAFTLSNSGVTAGLYGMVTVDAKGRVTAGTTVTDVAHGGIGKATVTSGALQKGAGTGALVDAVAGTDYVIPSALSSYVPGTRTITINGVTQDLSANRSFTVSGGAIDTTALARKTGNSPLFVYNAAVANSVSALKSGIGFGFYNTALGVVPFLSWDNTLSVPMFQTAMYSNSPFYYLTEPSYSFSGTLISRNYADNKYALITSPTFQTSATVNGPLQVNGIGTMTSARLGYLGLRLGNNGTGYLSVNTVGPDNSSSALIASFLQQTDTIPGFKQVNQLRVRKFTTSGLATVYDKVIILNGSSGGFNVTLPSAASAYDATLSRGNIYIIKREDLTFNTTTGIVVQGGGTINGATSLTIPRRGGYMVHSNGTSYDIISFEGMDLYSDQSLAGIKTFASSTVFNDALNLTPVAGASIASGKGGIYIPSADINTYYFNTAASGTGKAFTIGIGSGQGFDFRSANATYQQYNLPDRSGTVNISPSADNSNSSTKNLAYGGFYTFTGTTATWSLPAVSSGTSGMANGIMVKNTGTGSLTIQSIAAGNDIYDTAAVSSIVVMPGDSLWLIPNGTYFTRN